MRFIGVTGHNDGAAMAETLRHHDFDTVLMSLNAAQSANPVAWLKMAPIPAFEQENVAPSRAAWENFLRTHEDSVTV